MIGKPGARTPRTPYSKAAKAQLEQLQSSQFIKKLKVGDVLDGRVTALHARVAEITLIPGVTALMPGKRKRFNAQQFLPTNATGTKEPIRVGQGLRVKVEVVYPQRQGETVAGGVTIPPRRMRVSLVGIRPDDLPA